MKQTEEQLVKRAIAVIDQQNYHNLSLRKLTREIGLTTGAFYKHFASKEDLLQKVTARLSQAFADKMPAAGSSPEEQLLQIADYFVKEAQHHPNLMDFLFFNDQATAVLKEADSTTPFLARIQLIIKQIDYASDLSSQDFFTQIWSFIQGYSLLIKNKAVTYDPALAQT
ncbi:TetR/AcrR family transcriptional regulator, partial [Lactobacillus sp. XV13L]|nr:TetR/AcrR family transcriptional regulator [Lactobacillus sp. XV13L]